MNHAIQHRRALHQIPETSYQEFKTKGYLVEVLSSLKCEVIEVLSTGVCAYFDAKKEKTLAYRSDMDALPIQEETNLSFQSLTPGRMHACGHDGHMAMLLGFAEELNEMEELPYNVLLVFQPSEETVGGAKPICQTGIFEKYHVCAIYGTHLWPFVPEGRIASRNQELMAHASEVTITVHGKSTHCGTADEGIDALSIGCQLVTRLYEMESKIDPNEYRILKFGNFHSGTVRNILPELAILEGSYRSFHDATFQHMIDATFQIIHQLQQETGCTIDFEYTEGYPAVINDSCLFDKTKTLLQGELIELDKPLMIAEDFSFYQQKIPGMFMFLGSGKEIALHNCKFDIKEEVLQKGIENYKTLLHVQL